MKKGLCLIISFYWFSISVSQEKEGIKKDNPIVFIDGLLGFGNGSADGIVIGYTINYQFKGNLISFRNNYLASKNKNRNESFPFFSLFTDYVQGNSLNEYALLYGRRLIFDGSSLSFSTGISINQAIYRSEIDNAIMRSSFNYVAIPYEISFKFFKREKSRYRVFYGMIPIGQPTALSRSIGVKLFGSLGKESYFGLGITVGLGWHKKY